MKIIRIIIGLFIGIPVLCLEAVLKICCAILSLLILMILLPHTGLFERFTNSAMLKYACCWSFKYVAPITYAWFLTETVLNRLNKLVELCDRY